MRTILPFALLWIAGCGSAQSADQPQPRPTPLPLAEILRDGPDEFLKRFDKNQDGFITKDELPQQFARAFDRADANQDGKLDKKEIESLLKILREILHRNPPMPNAQVVDPPVNQLLYRFDAS